MIEELLAAADIPAKPARFSDPPLTHAVIFDSVDADGPDECPRRVITHDCTVELYAPSVEAGAQALCRLQSQLDARGIPYTTQGWYWLSAAQRYQEVIEFSYIEKN